MAVTVMVALPPPSGVCTASADVMMNRARLEGRMVLRMCVFMSVPLHFLAFPGDLMQRGRGACRLFGIPRSALPVIRAHWSATLPRCCRPYALRKRSFVCQQLRQSQRTAAGCKFVKGPLIAVRAGLE